MPLGLHLTAIHFARVHFDETLRALLLQHGISNGVADRHISVKRTIVVNEMQFGDPDFMFQHARFRLPAAVDILRSAGAAKQHHSHGVDQSFSAEAVESPVGLFPRCFQRWAGEEGAGKLFGRGGMLGDEVDNVLITVLPAYCGLA